MTALLFRKVLLTALVAVAIAAAFLSCAEAQTTGAAATQEGPARSAGSMPSQAANPQPGPSGDSLAVGRVIYAELTQTIEAKKARVGEPIFAKVTLAVLSHGKVLIADGARITGHLTEVKARSKQDRESVLGIVFDRAELPDGTELPLALTVQAVGIGSLERTNHLPGEDPGALTVAPGFPDLSTPRATGSESSASAVPKAETSPALDLGSKGMVGLKGLELTEGTDPTKGSLVESTTKDVKLGNRYELVLRVIAPKPEQTPKK